MDDSLYSRAIGAVSQPWGRIKDTVNTIISPLTQSIRNQTRRRNESEDIYCTTPRITHPRNSYGARSEPGRIRNTVINEEDRYGRDFERTNSEGYDAFRGAFGTNRRKSSGFLDHKLELRRVRRFSFGSDLGTLEECNVYHRREFGRNECVTRNISYESVDANGNTENVIRKISISSVISVRQKTVTSNDDISGHSSTTSVICIERQRISIDEIHRQRGSWSQGANVERNNGRIEGTPLVKVPHSSGEITGHITLRVQYFEKSEALRITVLNATYLIAQRGIVWGKLELNFLYSKRQKRILRNVTASSKVIFNEEAFFDGIGEDKMDQLILTLRLYNKERLLCSKKLLGEVILPVYKYDFSMDTDVKGYLRERKADKQNLEAAAMAADVTVTSDDRSLAATARASLRSTNLQNVRLILSQTRPVLSSPTENSLENIDAKEENDDQPD